MRVTILMALIAGVLAGCVTMTDEELAAMWNRDPRVWPPVVPGQAHPVQFLNDAST